MASVAKHCRDTRVGFAQSFSPNGQMLASGSHDGSRLWDVQDDLPQNSTRTYGLGLGSRLQPRWTHPCEWQQRSNRAAMGCDGILPQNPTRTYGLDYIRCLQPRWSTSNWQLRLISSTLNVQDGKLATLHDHTSEVGSVAFSPWSSPSQWQ